MTLAFKFSTVGKGVAVDVSVGAGVEVMVGAGMGVNVAVKVGAVSVDEISVDVGSGSGGDEAEGPPRLHARLAKIKAVRKNGSLFLISPIVPNPN
jgi:prefoldin subunit 5